MRIHKGLGSKVAWCFSTQHQDREEWWWWWWQCRTVHTVSFREFGVLVDKWWSSSSSIVSQHCTEVRFTSFLSGGFTTMAVIKPPESKLVKRTSVHWLDKNCELASHRLKIFWRNLIITSMKAGIQTPLQNRTENVEKKANSVHWCRQPRAAPELLWGSFCLTFIWNGHSRHTLPSKWYTLSKIFF